MNAVQRFAVRIAARIAPPLGHVLRMTGGTVDKLQEQVTLYREREQQRNDEAAELKNELIEAAGLAGTGPWLGSGHQTFAVTESAPKHQHRVKERLAELELALEDRGWQRQLAVASTEFSRYGIQQIMLISRLYFIKNPLIRRGVKISAMYVFGRGIEISSEDTKANDVIQDFLKNPANMAEWSHSGMVQKEETKWTDGNLFVALFTDPANGHVTTRTIDALEVEEIITDPDDSSVPWYYKRRWMSNSFDTTTGVTMPQMRVAWYVALDYVPPTKLTTIKNEPVMMANGQYIPVLHVKCGGLVKWHFGCPKVYSILDWARAYKKLMENWCTITAALARFSWAVETQGGAPALASLKASLATTLANDGTQIEHNPPPVTGSAFISGPGTKITPMKTAGAQTSPEEGRRILLMVAAGFGLPETFFGDASCYSDDTEVLTENGFMLHQEWRPGNRIACYNPETAQMEWQHAYELRTFAYSGQLVHFSSAQVDILVTPNHRMWCAPVINWKPKKPVVDRSWRIETAEHLEAHCKAGWRLKARFDVQEVAIDKPDIYLPVWSAASWAAFLGFWLSEGSVTESLSRGKHSRRIMLAQRPGDVLEEMRAALNGLGIRFNETTATAGVKNLVISCKGVYGPLWEWLKENGGSGSYSKKIPRAMLNAPKHLRQVLYDALMAGDGGESGSSLRYTSASKQLADDMQVLATSLGYAASVTREIQNYRGQQPSIYRVWIRTEWIEEAKIVPAKHITRNPYSGVVYCFSLPYGIYVTRRNGKIAVQGNTGSLATAQSLDRPTELQFLQEQESWREFLQRLFRYVLTQSALSAGGKLKEAKKQPQDITIKVEFPSVLEHDQLQAIQSIVEAMTLGNKGGQVTGIDEKVGVGLLFKELGVEDPQPILDAMYPEAEYDKLIDRTQQEEQQAPVVALTPDGKPVVTPGQPQPGQQAPAAAAAPKPKAKKTASEAQIQEAVQLVKKAIKRLNESKLFPTHDA